MALGTEAAAVNTAVLATIAAMEAYVDTLSQGDQIILVPLRMHQFGLAHNRWANDAGTLQWAFNQKHLFQKDIGTADRFPTHVGLKPIWWAVTNANNDLTA